jgi:hypothetical protein
MTAISNPSTQTRPPQETWNTKLKGPVALFVFVGLLFALWPLYMIGASLPFVEWSPGCLLLEWGPCGADGVGQLDRLRWDLIGQSMLLGFAMYYPAALLFELLTPPEPGAKPVGLRENSRIVISMGLILAFCAFVLGVLLPFGAVRHLFSALSASPRIQLVYASLARSRPAVRADATCVAALRLLGSGKLVRRECERHR